jgi:hypothetical protein
MLHIHMEIYTRKSQYRKLFTNFGMIKKLTYNMQRK